MENREAKLRRILRGAGVENVGVPHSPQELRIVLKNLPEVEVYPGTVPWNPVPGAIIRAASTPTQ